MRSYYLKLLIKSFFLFINPTFFHNECKMELRNANNNENKDVLTKQSVVSVGFKRGEEMHDIYLI